MATSDSNPLKRCSKCGLSFPATTEFYYPHLGKLRAACKTCTNKANSIYNKSPAGREVMRQSENRYQQTEYGKEKKRQKASRYRKQNPLKEQARKAVSIAVRNGTLPRVHSLQCLRCEKMADTYHHWAYEPEYWLDVIPLCWACHKKEHVQ